LVIHRSLNLAIVEIAFTALGPDGRPLRATMPMEVHSASFEQVLRDAQASGELPEFDVEVMAGLRQSPRHGAPATRDVPRALRRVPAPLGCLDDARF
jgi:hypothetical protein